MPLCIDNDVLEQERYVWNWEESSEDTQKQDWKENGGRIWRESLKRKNKYKWNWDDKNNIRMNRGHGWRIVYCPHRLVEGTWPYKLDQVNSDPKDHWYGLALGKIIGKLYMDQSVKLRLDQRDTKMWKLEEELDKNAIYHLFYSNSVSTSPKKLLGDWRL